VVIDVLEVFLRGEQAVILQRLPSLLRRVVCRIENDAMRVQMRIECAGSFTLEQRGCDVARGAHPNVAARMHLRRGKLIELGSSRANRFAMRGDNARIAADESSDRNGLRG